MITAGKCVTVGVRGVIGAQGEDFEGVLTGADELGVTIKHKGGTTIMFPWASVIYLTSTEEN